MRDIHNTFLMDLKQITQIKPYSVFKEKIQAEQAGNVIGDITSLQKKKTTANSNWFRICFSIGFKNTNT